MKLKDWTPSRFSVLCVNHFEEQYIDRTGKCVKLREDAVPTMFSSPDETQKRKVCIRLPSNQEVRDTSHMVKPHR
ncbi:THAP domain-containing protein 5-like isoform X2 [Seriola lalandi dorsalis]|uniref:THAP domain-containing protein 5-like isoform X2 n=1 Tax=Seriola lalandi dorsalis TaxID=1841481 RepID=UPI000C6F906E|nr:THAP domain-containing protein 5-like isoform X2 [Seriola lalandi dorsalis]